MTYRQLFESFKNQLKDNYDSRELESVFFLALLNISGYERIDFFMNHDQTLNDKELGDFNRLITDLKKSKPIQYALNEAWFNDHKYVVNENVLIPRPETEELIQLVYNLKPEANSIIDIGTGSGCIAIELALLLKSKVFAMDVSPYAIEIARQNATEQNATIEFLENNILDENMLLNCKFDVIVSNPPYVMESEKTKMKDNVLKYEPENALFVNDENPLLFYIAIRNFALKHANKNALIALEINEQLGQQTANLFSEQFINVVVHKDINGKDRFITGIYDGE